jgi:hypothetical protein
VWLYIYMQYSKEQPWFKVCYQSYLFESIKSKEAKSHKREPFDWLTSDSGFLKEGLVAQVVRALH